jgi:hypothetical protein
VQRFTTRLALAALVALALSTPRIAAAGGYTITEVPILPNTANSFCWQQSINNGGLLVCYARAFSLLMESRGDSGGARFLIPFLR